jgi:hypothetical protein
LAFKLSVRHKSDCVHFIAIYHQKRLCYKNVSDRGYLDTGLLFTVEMLGYTLRAIETQTPYL